MALSRYKPYAVPLAIALVASTIAWGFVYVTLHHTNEMGLPLDDSYIYLTYAKQFGRAHPFTYFPGGGYSAGSTSVLWPMLLAPFWALGARGHALVWVSFGMCTALYAAVAIGTHRLVRAIAGNVAAIAAAIGVLAIAPFTFCALSGMEVAFATALIIAAFLLLGETPPDGPPSRLLVIVLAATSLSRPEAMLLVFCIVAVAVVRRRKTPRDAARWLVPLVPPIVWLLANRVLAGNFMPNTGVAKSHFYLPGFDWTYWIEAVTAQTGLALRGLFWDATSPLVWPRAVAMAWLIGAIRVVVWSRKAQRPLVGTLVLAAPFVLILAVNASSGMWKFQHYRYIAPALPLIMLVAACTLAPLPWPARMPYRVLAGYASSAVSLAVAALFAYSAWPALTDDMNLFAQGAMDTNTQVVAIGRYVHAKLPDARVLFHDAGAIAYYGDGQVFDMLGLVTNRQAGVANNGPGSRFEFLEHMAPDQRPTHFAYYPGWLGTDELYGDVLMHTPLHPQFAKERLVGGGDMQVIAARWDHIETGERPMNDHAGWSIVDRVDVADLVSERDHHWVGALGRRQVGDLPGKWSVVGREVGSNGLVLDGGRTIRGGSERFTIKLDFKKPARIILRTGGARAYPPYNEEIAKPVSIKLFYRQRELGQLTIGTPTGAFSELTFNLPNHTFDADEVEVRTEATGIYRSFHWFIEQPE